MYWGLARQYKIFPELRKHEKHEKCFTLVFVAGFMIFRIRVMSKENKRKEMSEQPEEISRQLPNDQPLDCDQP